MLKNKKRIGILLFLLVASITIFFIVKQNSKDNDVSEIVVKNGMSINFLDGYELYASAKEKEYNFSITNNNFTETYYEIVISDFNPKFSIGYELVSEEAKINVKGNKISEKLVEYVVINPGDTHNFKLKLNKSLSADFIGNLEINQYIFEQEYFAQTIIQNSSVSSEPKTTVGMEISQTDEGLIQDIDDDGVTYYFRGDVKNNYVKFADKVWRIVRVNGNGTVKLILDGAPDLLTEYYTSNEDPSYFTYNKSSVKNALSTWYDENLKQYEKFINSGRLCDNNNFTGTDEYVFTANQRLTVNHNPSFNCTGLKLSSKIMLLTADEIEYAGGLIGVANDKYYLYNENVTNPTWTITPSKGNKVEFYPYALSMNGSLDDSQVGNQAKNVRPVININKDVEVIGKGTYEEPYEILY